MVKTARKEGLMDFYVGIDVSKFKHTIAIIDQDGEIRKKSFDISNSRKGFDTNAKDKTIGFRIIIRKQ